MAMIHDLHSHSTCSDGVLSPAELVDRAASNKVNFLALTDHDTTAGIAEAFAATDNKSINLIAGVEISAVWKDYEIHIIGLNIDPTSEKLQSGLEKQLQARKSRFEQMINKLDDAGISNCQDVVQTYKNGEHVGRPLVARLLVESGNCATWQEAFKKLGRGGEFHVKPNWAYMKHAVNWIDEAGGVAVIAHMDAYGISNPGLNGLCREFKEAGGLGLEICYGPCSKKAVSRCSHFAKKYKLCGSVGSDFHRPTPGIELGKQQKLPAKITPIWQHPKFLQESADK